MSTRSNIGIKERDGSVTVIYCHWDGYYDHNGKMLLDCYNTEEMARRLINLGDISALNSTLFDTKNKSDKINGDPTSYIHFDDWTDSLKNTIIEFRYWWDCEKGCWYGEHLWNDRPKQLKNIIKKLRDEQKKEKEK